MNDKTICIVDDDLNVCNALRWLFESVCFKVETYKNAEDLLKNFNEISNSCLILDVRMPGISGIELLEYLNSKKIRCSSIIVTGYGDIPMAVRAMKLGAYDFILKPFNDQNLLEVVQRCFQKNNKININEVHERINRLSERERQIIDLILEGRLNKQIAYDLSISISTVEAHRANIMQKMQAKNLAHLITIYLQAQLSESAFFNGDN